MEYREQLEYIKSHQSIEKKNTKKKRKNKISFIDKILWRILFFLSVIFIGMIVLINIFPVPYIIGITGVLVSILMIIKILQQRACKYNERKKKSKGRFLALLTIVVLMMGGYYLLQINNAIAHITVGEGQKADVTQTPFNIYISGIDVYGEITTESRSDVNLIATVHPQKHKILLTTTPRDYYVTIPGVSGNSKDKLTHAGIYGIDTSVATLENLYNTEIPFYARVNFSSVIDIVDAMGGIDVKSEVAFTTSKASGTIVEIKEGMNHLNGKEALAFVRERKAFVDGDNQRGKNQQALMTALIKKAVSPRILVQANDIIDSVVGNAETNMSEAQLKSLIKMQLDDLKGWDIQSVAASGDDSGKQYCYSYSGGPLYVCVPDENVVESIRIKIEELLNE